MTRLKIGLVLPQTTGSYDGKTPRWADMLAFVQRAEQLGFDSIWLTDHLLIRMAEVERQYGRTPPAFMETMRPVGVWECWSLMAALAAVTERVELGQVVTCTGYRNPAMLAKMADTVDEISGGRVILGLGAGDYADEHATFGYPWEQKVGRFEEALTIIHALLRTGQIDFEGEHYTLRECELRPRGPRREGPPILIGTLGAGPRMLRLTAQYADLWNGWFAFGNSHPSVVPPLRTVVDDACRKFGRDPATLGRTLTVGAALPGYTIRRSGAAPVTGTPEEMAATLRAFAEEGIDHLQLWLSPATVEGVEALAPVLEQLR